LIKSTIFQLQDQSHDDLGFSDRGSDALVRQNLASVDVQLVLDNDVLPEHRVVLHPNPPTHDRTPSDYAALQPRMRLHSCTLWTTFFVFNYTANINEPVCRSKTVLARSSVVAINFRVYLPQFGESVSGISD